MGTYGACFLLAAVIGHKVADNSDYRKRIPFVMDAGNPYAEHVRNAHQTALTFQQKRFLNMGSLSFEDDERVLPLQAAEAVSWTVRRRLTGKFANGFDPLQNLLDRSHVEHEFADDYMAELANKLRSKPNP